MRSNSSSMEMPEIDGKPFMEVLTTSTKVREHAQIVSDWSYQRKKKEKHK